MEREEAKCQKQLDQQNIRLNNPSTILPTSDEKIRHAQSSNNDNSSSDEWQST